MASRVVVSTPRLLNAALVNASNLSGDIVPDFIARSKAFSVLLLCTPMELITSAIFPDCLLILRPVIP